MPDGTWAALREDAISRVPAGAPPAQSAHASAPAAGAVAGAPPAQPPGQPAGQSAPVPPTPAPPTGPPSSPKRRRPVLRVLKWAAIAYVVWLIGLLTYASLSLPQTQALSPNPIPDTSGSVWLMVGSDSRAGLTPKEQSQLHTGNEEGQRTDTIMIVRMAAGEAPTMISVPRDSWVTIPAHTAKDGSQVPDRKGKINAAFAYGGAPLLSETIEYNTGLHVDHYMEVGFGGIVAMTNAVGGIEACFDEAVKDRNSGLDVEAGCQNLDGREALAWVRMRYADPKGDLGRIERQQQYVASMVDEILSWQTLVNPFRQLAIVNAVLDSILVDENTGPFDLGRFGLGMGRIASGGGEVTTVPIDDSSHWAGGQWVINWDRGEADELFASLGGSTPQATQTP